jgi:hypothetical protein
MDTSPRTDTDTICISDCWTVSRRLHTYYSIILTGNAGGAATRGALVFRQQWRIQGQGGGTATLQGQATVCT